MKLMYSSSTMTFEIVLDIRSKEIALSIPHTRHPEVGSYTSSHGLHVVPYQKTLLVNRFLEMPPFTSETYLEVGVACAGTTEKGISSKRRFVFDVPTVEMLKRVTKLYLSVAEFDRHGGTR